MIDKHVFHIEKTSVEHINPDKTFSDANDHAMSREYLVIICVSVGVHTETC
jgi:hypothetical protein